MDEHKRPQYITQLNCFHHWLNTHYLPSNAKLLWFMLIGQVNACGWADWVQIDTTRLMNMLSVQSECTALRARDALVRAGLLTYKKGRKGYPNRYRLVYFSQDERRENDSKNDSENDSKNDSQNEGKTMVIEREKTKTKTKTDALLSPSGDDAARKRAEVQAVAEAFNRICASLPKVQTLNEARRKAVAAAAKTVENAGGWERLFAAVEASDFLCGRTGAWNGCSFDWILKPGNLVKIIEGNYTDKPARKEASDYAGVRIGTVL